jgi:lipopolysaccharide/colanic/teichoic acid biosynthesis glycosyltransferase
MVPGAENLGGSCTGRDDPRLTRAGRYLRRYKLDEIPQLVNVLSGDMSLVGPRPEVRKYVDMYAQEEKTILTVRPGITDWATLWNSDEESLLAGQSDPEKIYMDMIRPEKLRLQMEYVRRRSFWVDMTILGATLRVMASRLLGSSPVPPTIGDKSLRRDA